MSSILSGGSPLEKGRANESLTDFKRRVAEAINDPGVHMMLMQPFMEYITQYQALNQAPIPISQIFGFTQFTANSASVATSETTTSGTYVDLATTGPTLSGIADGQYLVVFGSGMSTVANPTECYMSISSNGSPAADADSCSYTANGTAGPVSVARAVIVTVEAGLNTITAKYRSNTEQAVFENRWLVALKVANA